MIYFDTAQDPPTNEEANNTQPVLPIMDPLINEVRKVSPTHTSLLDYCLHFFKHPFLTLHIFCSPGHHPKLLQKIFILEDITRVVGATCSGSGDNESVEVSESLCLVKFVAGKSFQRIPSNFWPKITIALNVLSQATSLSSVQSFAIQELNNQFEDLCKSYSSASAVLQSTREQLESNLGNYLFLSPKVFTIANFEAGVVKDDWDAFMANKKDQLEQDEEKAENELAIIEANWVSFAAHFK